MSDDNFIAPMSPGGAAGGTTSTPAPQYRQVQSPTQLLEARFLPDSGAANRAAALADTFKQFSKTSQDVADKLNINAGTQDGAAAGLDPNFAPKTGLAAITAYGSAYDAAAHVSYVNAQHTAMEGQASDIEQKSAGDPVTFTTVATAARDAAVKNASPIYQPEILASWNQRIMAGTSRLKEQAIVTARSDAWESYTSSIDSRQRAALTTAAQLPPDQQAAVIQNTITENRQQLDALVTARAITPEKSAVLQNRFVEALQNQVHGQYTSTTVDRMMDLARAGDVDAADAAMHAYVTDPNNSDTDKNAVIKDYEDEREKYTKLQSQVHAKDIANVGQQLVQGDGEINGQGAYGSKIEPQIHQLYKIGAINPEGLHSLLDQSMRNQVKAIGDSVDNYNIDALMHGQGQKLDPKDTAAQDAVDTYFKSHIALNGTTPADASYAIGASAIVKATNIVPKSVQSQIRIGLISGDPVGAVNAARLADRIQQNNPQADLYASDPKLAALSSLINDNLRAGMAPAAAYTMATSQVNVTPSEKDIRDKAYADAIRKQNGGNADATNAAALQKSVNSLYAPHFWNSNPPAAPVAMQAEYESLVKQFYQNTTDLPKSQALAAAQLQKTWGVSKVNGAPEIMKYPIPDADVPLVRADIAKSAAAAGYTGDAAQLHLTPNGLTDQSSGRYWSVTHTDEHGVTDTVLDSHNQPIVYDARQSPQDYAKYRQGQIDKKLDDARQLRDVQRSMDAEQIPGEKHLADFYLKPSGAMASVEAGGG